MITPINVLQIGQNSWQVPPTFQTILKWNQCHKEGLLGFLEEDKAFDMVIIEEELSDADFGLLALLSAPYRVWFDSQLKASLSENAIEFCRKFCAKFIDLSQKDQLLHQLVHSYFPRQYGEKLKMASIFFNEQTIKEKMYLGHNYILLEALFSFHPIQFAGWKHSIYKDPNRNLEFWLEFSADPGLSLYYKIYEWDESGNFLQEKFIEIVGSDPLIFQSASYHQATFISINLWYQGQGNLYLGALHWRHSLENGYSFIPGGQRFVASSREEFFYYFSPGNLKPPLNIYFSGYRTQEGFEGYYMMEKLGHPFILFSDPRVEGGAFYLGPKDYEQAIIQIIQKYIKQLGFDSSDLILSGLSMGTFAALYYGCQLQPHAIIIGKPLIDMELIAQRTSLERPDDFLTILDIVQRHHSSINGDHGRPDLANILIEKMSQAQMGNTILAVAYMLQDDYDNQAFNQLSKVASKHGNHMIAKALEGRHNDDSPGIFEWFISQYRRILADDFDKGVLDE